MKANAPRVLVVEDNPDNRYLATLLLEAEGYVVRPAHNGAEALVSILTETYAFVVLDIQLPDLDGFEVARRIRARAGDVPIIAVSAFATLADRRLALEAGCCGYIEKPIDADHFVAEVRQLAGLAAA